MKIVKVNKEFLAKWRANVAHLVDDGGHLVCELERPLANHLAVITRTARSQRKTITQKVAVGSREHLIRVDVQRAGINADDLALTPTIDGHRVVTGREVLCAQMFQLHGECQLRWPNNVILKVIRDPNVHRPTFAESQQIAPRPEHCPCKNWGAPHPGTHYPTCHWNRLAPPDERAPSDQVPEEEVRVLPTEAFETLKQRPASNPATTPITARVDPSAVVTPSDEPDSPETCRNQCSSWATPKGFPIPKGQHHPTCIFARAWAIKTARETPRWLIDLNTGQKVRHATDEEVGEADIAAQRLGQPVIHIEEVPYAVILETELAEVDDTAVIAPSGKLDSTGTGG